MQNNPTFVNKENAITAYKGFDKNLTCRGFIYKVGETFSHHGKVVVCEEGFHACVDPKDVFAFYPPAGSSFAVVKLWGNLSWGDNKVAAEHIEVIHTLSLPEFIGVLCKEGTECAASASGDYGAASATGYRGAASASGDYGAASATGYYGAASATGYNGAASATGYRGAASATGNRGRVMGTNGNALFLTERDDEYNIVNVWAGIVGVDGVQENVWYTLQDGKLVVVED